MKKNHLLFSFVLVLVLLAACKSSNRPTNPHSSEEAQKLLSFLYNITGEKTLSGQHNYPHELTRSSDSIVSITGKHPAIWGTDLSSMSDEIFAEAKKQYEQGAIITLMYHQVKPFDHDSMGFARSVKGRVTDQQWKEIITPGTPFHRMWLEKIDQRAEFLKKFSDAKIPVLWRPYHEMNGMWFWYGNRPGPEGIAKLWRMMYDRYVNYHQLNNLIWVWNANAPRNWKDDEAYDYHLFYPGNEYVDVLAADVYKNDFQQSHHDQLVELGKGKPIALGEVGQMPNPAILKEQPNWCWFMCWARFPWTDNKPQAVRELYDSERVVTLEELQKHP